MTDKELEELVKKVENSKPNKCWFRHKWTIWSDPFRIQYTTVYHETCVEDRQKRYCLNCHMIQARRIRVD